MDDLAVFDYHHVEHEEKIFELGDGADRRALAKCMAESRKVRMICCVCHRKIHQRQHHARILSAAEELSKDLLAKMQAYNEANPVPDDQPHMGA